MYKIPKEIYENESLSLPAIILMGYIYKHGIIKKSWYGLAALCNIGNKKTARDAAHCLQTAELVGINTTGKGRSVLHRIVPTRKAIKLFVKKLKE